MKIKLTILKWVAILLGSLSWSVTMIKSGWVYSYGIGFWGANGHDGIWHIALAESLAKGSFNMPIFAGARLQNYHIGFDLILALLHKITFLPVANLYFQILPPIFAFLIGYLTYKFVYNWQKSNKAALISTIFVYFGGSFAWLIGKGESAFWAQQSISTLINPPLALSFTIMLLAMVLYIKENKKILDYLVLIILFGILVEIKAYAGFLCLGGLFLASIYKIFIQKKYDTLLVFVGSLILSILMYLPLNGNSVGLAVWQPFWFLETMVAATDRLFLPKLAEAMSSYKYQHVIRKFVLAYGAMFAVFILGNFGTRLLFLFRKIKKLSEIEVFIYSIIAAGILIPTFFVQKGTPWNTIQFVYYSIFLSGLIAGIVLSKLNRFIIFFLIILTIPTTVLTLKDVYIPPRPPAALGLGEIEALKFLKAQPEGTVLTYPFDYLASDRWTTAPKPLNIYVSSAYVSAFSGKDVYMEDTVNLDIMRYGLSERITLMEMWYKEVNQDKARQFLIDSKIKYVYWVKPQRAILGDKQLGLKNIFENSEATIFQVAPLGD